MTMELQNILVIIIKLQTLIKQNAHKYKIVWTVQALHLNQCLILENGERTIVGQFQNIKDGKLASKDAVIFILINNI